MPFNSISHKTHAIQQHLSQNTCHSTASLTKHMPFNSISHKTHAIQQHLSQNTCHSTASLIKHMPFNSISHKTHAIQQHLSQNTPFNSISHKTHAIQQHLSQNTCHSTASLIKHMPFNSISHKTHAIQQHLSQNTCHSTASLTKHMPFNSISAVPVTTIIEWNIIKTKCWENMSHDQIKINQSVDYAKMLYMHQIILYNLNSHMVSMAHKNTSNQIKVKKAHHLYIDRLTSHMKYMQRLLPVQAA